MATKLGTILADFSTALSTDIAIGGTTATLSTATDDDAVALPSGRYFFTLDGGNSSKEHISCDLVGTALTNIKSLSRQGVETTGCVRKHRIGASVSLTDFGHIKFINDLVAGTTQLNASAPLGYDAAPASLTGNQLATVTYVLGVVNGGTVTFDQQVISAQTSGEAIAINDIVYFKESDARWYKADADLIATFNQLQLGVCKTTAGASGVTIQVAISGPVSAFSGLSAGSKYYLSNTGGAISSTEGTNSVFVGWALTTTILLFAPEKLGATIGSQGVPTANNSFVTKDNTSANGTDQTQTTQNGSVEVGEANATSRKHKLAQSFIPTKTKIQGIRLSKQADSGSFTGTVTVALQADTSGSPSGSDLATKTLTNAEWSQILNDGTAEFLFSSEYSSIVANNLYWIVLTTSTSDNTNHPNFGTNTAGGYASGSVKYNNTTDGWVAVSTIDLYFETIEGHNNQAVKTDSNGQSVGFTKAPVINLYTIGSTIGGASTTRFDVTNPSGSIFRYTYDGTGTDPLITASNPAIGTTVNIQGVNFDANNRGVFIVTGSGTNYFEVFNASGVAENDKTLGTGGYIFSGHVWNKPQNLSYAVLEVVGGGAGGGGYFNNGTTDTGGGGGGAGGYSKEVFSSSELNANVPLAAGIKGGGGGTSANDATAGATSYFGSYMTATGGSLGNWGNANLGLGGNGGIGAGGDINIKGGAGASGQQNLASANGGAGGSNPLGGGSNNADGGNYGAGGAGGSSATGGYNGADGVVIVTEYY